MSWNIEGKKVYGNYNGTVPVMGIVIQSSVTSFGKVIHLVRLFSPITFIGQVKHCVILEPRDVIEVYS